MAAILTLISLPRTRLPNQTVIRRSRTTIEPIQSLYINKSTNKLSRSLEFEPFTRKKTNLSSQILRLSAKDLGSKVNPSCSLVETIKHLYECINDKNLKELGDLIASDCFINDYSFFAPFQGKKETIQFFEQLIGCMGQNVKFVLDLICEGSDGFTIAVMWHLEWKKKMIPLTKACSFYEFSMTKDSNLVLRKAHVLVESPIKPGALALGFFMAITSLFDAFPQATQWFLDNPHVMMNIIEKIYRVTLGPFISPFLQYYPKVINFVTFLINFTLKILFLVSKIFPF
ncbi:uncharacterized protein LOC124944117 [Impatiens glandulifera]|uniref:uncharacterized protein LOC124944117 n=1 Tax=Impatiens glandulifera TaxID=253017 RepID=UPI001FB16CF1|nr:uncharacterized protein LOC124944117 [Impatiens glandulifera]